MILYKIKAILNLTIMYWWLKKNVNMQQKNRIMYNLGCVCIDFSSKIIKKLT